MQFLNIVLLQLDEACRHIMDGRLAQLRIALLLLDNAGEIQMERCANNYLMQEVMQEKLKYMALQIPADQRNEDFQKLADWEPLTYSDKLNVSRNFDDKVKYLTERAKQLDRRLAGPLIYLHRYRNEAYHYARVRKDTIETAARLLLEINCILLLSLTRGWTAYVSNEDYSWLTERFGKQSIGLVHDNELVPKAVQEFRNVIMLNDDSVSKLLADHLLSRIQGVHDSLKFIVENTKCPDRETAIRDSHAFHMARCKQEGRSTRSLASASGKHSLNFLSDLQKKLKTITKARDRLKSFHLFSKLESDFDPVEQSVKELAAEIDGMIQMAVDIARGK